MPLDQYINPMSAANKRTNATEHKYWDYLPKLIEALFSDGLSTNETKEILKRFADLKLEIANQISTALGLTFVPEKEPQGNVCMANNEEVRAEFKQTFAPIDILDYIYAVLHSPKYREKYKEFLKIVFPKIPFPKDVKTFWDLVALGKQIREIHLLENPIVEEYITEFNIDGNCVVGKPRFEINPNEENSPQPNTNTKRENSPPMEGCPTGGVVPDIYIKNSPIFFHPVLVLPYNPKLKERAKALRYARNLSEVLFWMQVHKSTFHNIDFDRQRIIGNYIVDFYVKKLGLVIEIDGPSHDNNEKYDAARDTYLKSLGLRVYHIPVTDVLQNMKTAMKNLELFIIEEYGKPSDSLVLQEKPPHPTGTPPVEGNLKKGLCGKIFINETQYFDNVPEVSWNFYIGGYQPAQKWLKDRKERKLEFDDIAHYQKIIVALTETDRLMKAIDAIEIE